MEEYINIINDFNRCISLINENLIVEECVDSEISYIQVKCAITLAREINERMQNIFSKAEREMIDSYIRICDRCLLVFKDLQSLENVIVLLNKEMFISEEMLRYVIVKLTHMTSILDKIVHDMTFCKKLLPFSRYAIDKFNEYNNFITDIVKNNRIK